jgi:hypothetical protein
VQFHSLESQPEGVIDCLLAKQKICVPLCYLVSAYLYDAC